MPKLHEIDETRAYMSHMIETSEVFVACRREPVGFVALQGERVALLYVAEAARGRGLGARLLERARQDRTRLDVWAFQANLSALRFYRREGFAEVERTDGEGNAEGLPDMRLEWRG